MRGTWPDRVVAHLRAHHDWYWVPALYGTAFVYIYRFVFFPGDGPQLGFGWDTIESYWSDVAFMTHQLGGDWPQWNPFDKGGYPYFAMPDRGSYYPVNWGLAWIGAALGDAPWWLMQLKDYLHHVAAAVCMHVFLRHRGLPRSAAAVGGATWLACSPWLIHKASGILWPMTWIPLVWLVIDRVVDRPTWRLGCALAAILALAGHAGSTPGFFYVLLATVPYGAFRAAGRLTIARKQGELAAVTRRLALVIGLAAVLAVMLLAVVYVPAQELTALSNRANRDMSYVLSFPLPAADSLIGLLAPSNGKMDAFAGSIPVTLALIAVAVRPLRDRGAAVFFAVMAALFMALSFGDATPLLRWLATHVPGFDLFRVSNRYKLLAMPMLAAAAGFGAAALIDASRRWTRQRVLGLVAIAVVVAAVVTLVAVLPQNKGRWVSEGHAVWLAVVGALLAAGALLASRTYASVLVVAMLPVIVYAPQHWIHHANRAVEKQPDHREDLAWIDGLEDVRTTWRIYDEFVLGQRVGPRLGIREFRGYAAGGTLEYRRYARVLTYAKKHPEILTAFSIRYIFHGGHHRAGKRPNHLKRRPDRLRPKHYRQLITTRCQELRNPRACPVFEAIRPIAPVRWYGAVTVQPTGKGGPVLNSMRRQIDSPAGLRAAAIEGDGVAVLGRERAGQLSAAFASPPDPVDGEVLALDANRMRVRVRAPGPGVVVVSDTMYPGWRPYVNGEARPPFYANWLSRGVAVDAGDHVIEWRFEPRGNTPLRWAWALAFLAVLLAAVLPRRRGRPGPPEAPPDTDAGGVAPA